MNNKNLVSVVIISYNSEKYILDVLESVKWQTYKNLELIISDDGSTDKTVLLADGWLNENKSLFKMCKLVANNKNTGITANCNRGLKSANGQYVKLIAADDLLLENCIEDLLQFCLNNELEFCFSRVLPFSENEETDYIKTKIKDDRFNYDYFFNKKRDEQYKALLRLTTPFSIIVGGFYSINLLKRVGFYNEEYEMMEDYPFILMLSRLGYRFELLDVYTCKYRVREPECLIDYKTSKRYNLHYMNLRSFRKKVVIKEMIGQRMYFSAIYMVFLLWLLSIEYKQDSKFLMFIFTVGRRLKQFIMAKGVAGLRSEEKK
ncbi:glycosyltransferase family 2 protein [Desulfobotulus mexicanus]|uniref:Glycosyltransferase family 2 protein n=1 Tax=Desulfobotulus mexicanus TaxID=2586642 RepID=A0A5Q4VH20_9BACT|nr:glycosyltransferase family 2 protein [Desulfobotulus mexicanus]TYT76146.1 glycosyltransferase family 2 protein [Desulfobotulus mexicanus]